MEQRTLSLFEERHDNLLRYLDRAILLTQEMIDLGNSSGVPRKPVRKFGQEDLKIMYESLRMLREAVLLVRLDSRVTDMSLEHICSHEGMVKFLANKLRVDSVLRMRECRTGELYAALDECEALGMKGQHHMYTFAEF